LFEFINHPQSVPEPARSLAASIVVHSLAILMLFALRLSDNAPSSPVLRQSVVLITPIEETPVTVAQAPRTRSFRKFHPSPPHPVLPDAPIIPVPPETIFNPTLPEQGRVIADVSGSKESKAAAPSIEPEVVVNSAEATRTALSTVRSFDPVYLAENAPRKATVITQSSEFSDASVHSASVANHHSIVSGAFGDVTAEKSTAALRQTITSSKFTPVEIVSKPRPAYTVEARDKNIEGEVLLEVEFSSSGVARVLRVVHALGAGLDETAISAAQGIRFHPATRDGSAVDSSTIVHIVFELAR
jgi:TonB family protein